MAHGAPSTIIVCIPILLPRIRNKSGSKITEICLVNYVRLEIVQTVLKIGPY